MSGPLHASAADDNGWPAPSSGFAQFGRRLENVIRWITEVPAAVLVILEIVLLLGNVTFRYALHMPLMWGDELASLLFIWLAMFGAVIALRRGEHMRLTTFVGKMPKQRQIFFETFGGVIVLAFMLMLIHPAWDYVIEEWVITTPALEIPHSIRVAAVAVGVTLMLLITISRLLERARREHFLVSAAIVCGVAILLWALKSVLPQLGSFNLLIFFLFGVTVMVTIGVPIMTAFGLATLAAARALAGARR